MRHTCIYFSDAAKFISVLLTSLSTMLQIELPHVNVLSKCDLIEKYGKLAFNLEFYTEVLDLSYILDELKVSWWPAVIVNYTKILLHKKITVQIAQSAEHWTNSLKVMGSITGLAGYGMWQKLPCASVSNRQIAIYLQRMSQFWLCQPGTW